MIVIGYPQEKPSIRMEAGKEIIYCIARKRWMQLTPEEWVRQNFLLFLVRVKGYPLSLIAVEKQIILGEMKKRFDIVVFDSSGNPFFIIECKAMHVPLSEDVLQQALRYNINLQAKYLAITNGVNCAVFFYSETGFKLGDEIPDPKFG